MKKLINLSVIACLLSGSMMSLFASSETELENAYMLGYFHALEQQQRNFKVQGINKAKVSLNKYIVALDTSSLPTYKLLMYQQIGYTESLTPIIVNDKYMVFNSYERKADAIYLQDKVLNSFHFKTKEEKAIVIENDNPNGWFKSQFVQKGLFDTLLDEVNKNVKGKVYVVKEDNGLMDNQLDALENMNKKENIPVKEPVTPPRVMKKEVINTYVVGNRVPPKQPQVKEVFNNTQTKAVVPVASPNEEKAISFKLKSHVTFNLYHGGKNDPYLYLKSLIPDHDATSLVSDSYKFVNTKKSKDGTVWVNIYKTNLWVEKNEIEIIN